MKNILKNTQSLGHEELEDFLENATVGIHWVDEQGTIVYANKAELQLLGYTPDEYIGHKISEFHADQPVIESIFSKLLNREQLSNQEARLRCKDGSFRDVLINSNVYSKDEKFIHTRCFTRDNTSRKKVEKLLRFINRASEELATTLDTEEALDKITKFIVPEYADWFTIDILKDDKIELVKLAHVDPEKYEWARLHREKNPVDLEDQNVGSIGHVIKTKEAVLLAEITDERIRASAKNEEHLEILKNLTLRSAMVVPMMVKGKVMGVVCFLSCTTGQYDEEDIDFAKDLANRIALTLENSQLYQELKSEIKRRIELDKIKDEFLSMASHELKTPVTSLKAYTQILQMNFEKEHNSVAADMLTKMDKQIDKLNRLIIDLLDITKVDNGELIFDIEEFEFNKLVVEIVEEMQRTTQTHIIKVDFAQPEMVSGDRNRIGQIITNLISNAIKYSPNSPEIFITGRADDKIVKLCVKDTGIGIPAEEQSKIFNRFYRANSKNKHSTFPGLGLGLYISCEIIKKHSGHINFESEEDKGSSFCFSLPKINK